MTYAVTQTENWAGKQGNRKRMLAAILTTLKWAIFGFLGLLLGQVLALDAKSQEAVWGLLWLIGVDITTGLVAALKVGSFRSRRMWWGILGKALTVVAVLSLHKAESIADFGEFHLEVIGAAAWGLTELTSILENLAIIGVAVPADLIANLKQFSADSFGAVTRWMGKKADPNR